MSSAILQAAKGAALAAGTWDGVPGNHIDLADQTATTATQAFVAPVRAVRAYIWQKQHTAGTALTPTSTWSLVVADNSAFTSNVRVIASKQTPRTPSAFILTGVVPDNLTAQWCQVTLSKGNVSDSMTFDVSIDAT